MPECRVLIGDWIEQLRTLPDESVNCCVTSPPYWGLRDYGVAGQLGLERTPDEYVAKVVEGFREVRRVLRKDGTLWLNLGDSYCSQGGLHDDRIDNQSGVGASRVWRNGSGRADGIVDERGQRNRNGNCVPGLKTKDLVGIPWMVAFALRADGWYLRQDIIWAKTNPMPESVRDRCTKSHEHIFLLSKNERYYFDASTIKEPAKRERWGNQTVVKEQQGTAGWIGNKLTEELHTIGRGGKNAFRGQGSNRDSETGPANRNGRDMKDVGTGMFRNKRDVWTISTRPYPGAHFATFPPKLIEPCVLAGCPTGGIVLDPFGGSGTTAQVALSHERNVILVELNAEYAPLIDQRIALASRR